MVHDDTTSTTIVTRLLLLFFVLPAFCAQASASVLGFKGSSHGLLVTYGVMFRQERGK